MPEQARGLIAKRYIEVSNNAAFIYKTFSISSLSKSQSPTVRHFAKARNYLLAFP